MPNFLNLTLPIKQDDASQTGARAFVEGFGKESQPIVNHILKGSQMVHHARAIVIESGGKVAFLQVITEYDGDLATYSVFFSKYLPTFFAALFQYVEDGLTLAEIKDPNTLMPFIEKHDLPSLGNPDLRFHAYPQSVPEIQAQFGIVPPPLPELPPAE
jgi:hypothetical protein